MFGKNHLMRQLLSLVLLVVAGGTLGYTLVEDGWSLFDGFYMTLITLTTIGFGEVSPLARRARRIASFMKALGFGSFRFNRKPRVNIGSRGAHNNVPAVLLPSRL